MSYYILDLKMSLSRLIKKIPLPRWLLITVGVLIVIRMLLPLGILHGINWALENKLGTYSGQLEDFDLSLYRGAYQAEGLIIQKKKSDLPPLLKVGELDLSIAWRRLLRGELDGDIVISDATVALLDSEKKENKQNGSEEKNWNEALQVLVPITVESLKLKNAAILFSNPDLTKNQMFRLEKIDLIVEDIRSRANQKKDLSPLSMSAVLQDHAQVKIEGTIDALETPPKADLDFSVIEFKPKTVNELLLSYVPIDLTNGQVSLYGEAAMAEGEIKGYVNAFMKNIDVVAPEQELFGMKHFLIETATSFANWFLKNDKKDEVAAHIPFRRVQGKFDVDASKAIWSALQNKKEEIPKGIQNSISLSNIIEEK